MATKDFGLIESDYAFFMAHASEAENDAAAYARELAEFEFGRTSIRLLDFGCGTGDFTERLTSRLNWPPEILRMTLVEPVRHQLAEAAQRLSKFSQYTIECLERLPDVPDPQLDLVLSNHVLYYVEDLDVTIGQMCASLTPGGKMLLAIAGLDNPLIQLWKTGFAMLGKPIPYHVSEDLEAVLKQRGVRFQKSAVPYQLRFVDTEENRLKIIRFLFGEHLQELSAQRLVREFDRFVRHGHIEINTDSDHFVIDTKKSQSFTHG